MARRNRVDPALLAASKRKQPEDRPKCPTCGLRAPHYRDPEGGASWFQTFGHRCPHGEPCPGWDEPGEWVETCPGCSPLRSRYVRELVEDPCHITRAALGWLQSDQGDRDRIVELMRERWPECVAAAEILARKGKRK